MLTITGQHFNTKIFKSLLSNEIGFKTVSFIIIVEKHKNTMHTTKTPHLIWSTSFYCNEKA